MLLFPRGRCHPGTAADAFLRERGLHGTALCCLHAQCPNHPASSPYLAAPQRSVFYAALSPLIAFYVLFTALLYPLHGSLHLNGFYAATAALVPQGLHGLLKGGCGAAPASPSCAGGPGGVSGLPGCGVPDGLAAAPCMLNPRRPVKAMPRQCRLHIPALHSGSTARLLPSPPCARPHLAQSSSTGPFPCSTAPASCGARS